MRFINAKVGRKNYKQRLLERCQNLKREIAIAVYKFQVPSNSGGTDVNPMYTGFFRMNWNISIGDPDESVEGFRDESLIEIQTKNGSFLKREKNYFSSCIVVKKAEMFFDSQEENISDINSPYYVCNGVEYGSLLNKGGTSPFPHAACRFIELCEESIKQQTSQILKNIRRSERR